MAKPQEPRNPAHTSLPEKAATRSSIEEELERQIGPLVSQHQRGEILNRVVAVVRSEQFSGPIAHPRHLREYEEIQPGAADRIIAMAEREQQHGIAMEKAIVDAEIADRKRGMRFGLAALCLMVALSFTAGYLGNNTLAGMLLGVGLLGVVGVFVNGRLSKDDP